MEMQGFQEIETSPVRKKFLIKLYIHIPKISFFWQNRFLLRVILRKYILIVFENSGFFNRINSYLLIRNKLKISDMRFATEQGSHCSVIKAELVLNSFLMGRKSLSAKNNKDINNNFQNTINITA